MKNSKILNKMGIVVTKEKTIRRPITANSYEDAIWSEFLQPTFHVKADCLCDFFAWNFIDENPYIKTLAAYKDDNALKYEKSPLYHFYCDFQPSTVEDVFLNGQKRFATEKSKGLFEYILPWDSTSKINGDKKLMYSGPMSDSEGKQEFKRLIDVYLSIKDRGYKAHPSSNLFDSSQIQGYFLEYNGQYKFIVLNGKHRAATLIVLNETDIPVSFRLGKPRVVRFNEINYWPQVRNGRFSADRAKEVFEAFFI